MNILVQFKMQHSSKILIVVDHEYTALNIATFIVKNKLEKNHYYILLDNCNYYKEKNIKDIFSFLKSKFYYYSKLKLEYKYFRILELTSFYKIYKLNKKNKFKALKFYNQTKLLQKNFKKIFFSRSESSRIILNHFN